MTRLDFEQFCGLVEVWFDKIDPRKTYPHPDSDLSKKAYSEFQFGPLQGEANGEVGEDLLASKKDSGPQRVWAVPDPYIAYSKRCDYLTTLSKIDDKFKAHLRRLATLETAIRAERQAGEELHIQLYELIEYQKVESRFKLHEPHDKNVAEMEMCR